MLVLEFTNNILFLSSIISALTLYFKAFNNSPKFPNVWSNLCPVAPKKYISVTSLEIASSKASSESVKSFSHLYLYFTDPLF